MYEDANKKLNDLIHLDNDAIRAYRQAIDACETPEVKQQLTSFMGDHERHVKDLDGLVRSQGGTPVEGPDVKGFLIEGFTAIMSRGERSALHAMRGNEELTSRLYDAARKATLPAEAMTVVERNYQDEVRHLAWIKDAINRRVWEHGKAA
jgi:uncharacterized protein (TIGR02284 family)